MQKLSKFLNMILQPQVFTVCYILWLSVNMVAVINPLSFTRYFLAFFAVWAFAVCVRQYLFQGLSPYQKKMMPMLLAFLGFCLVAEIVQFRYTGVKMIVQLCFFAIAILLLYTQYKSDAEVYKKTLLWISKGLGIWISLTMLASIVMFITLYSGTVILRLGTELHFGFYENRLVGVFTSPNVGGMFALILIWASLITWELHTEAKNKTLWRVLCVVQILLSCTYISLALSRGTYLTVFTFMICYLLLHTPFAKELTMTRGKQIAFRLLVTVLVCTLLGGSFSVLHKVSCAMMEVSYKYQVEKQPDSPDALKRAELLQIAQLGFEGRTEANRGDIDISNKRFNIWQSHVSLLKGRNLLFGIGSPVNYYEKTLADGGSFTDFQRTFIEWASGNMHNGYLQILVNCGVFAFLTMIVFLMICLVRCAKHIFFAASGKRDAGTNANRIFTLCIPLVVAILANNVMETNFVLMGANFFQAVFWFAAGACVQAIDEAKQLKDGDAAK